jgi:iron(III) transport system permease protein
VLSHKALRGASLTLVGILGFVVLLPILALVFGSFWSASPVSLEGHFTLQNWIKAYSLRIPATVSTLFLNSLAFAFLVAVISVALGIIMAYLVARTDMPYGYVFEKLSIAPRAFPVLIAALAWVMLLSPRIGVLNLVAREYLGFSLFNIYSFPGMIFLMVL